MIFLYNCFRSLFLWILVLFAFASLISDYKLLSYYNCVLFIFYIVIDLLWFPFIKFRKDLFIHHIVCLIIFIPLYPYYHFIGNKLILGELLSIFNNILSNRLLKMYRFFIIFVIRIPLWLDILYFNITTNEFSHFNPIFLFICRIVPVFFIIYDIRISNILLRH